MKKSTYIYLTIGAIALVAFLISNDVIAQTKGEDEIIRISERVLDVVLNFFKSILTMLGDFLKDLIPFFGSDTPSK